MVNACLIGVLAGVAFRPLILIPVIIGFFFFHLWRLVFFSDSSLQVSGSQLFFDIVALNVSYLVGALLRKAVTARS